MQSETVLIVAVALAAMAVACRVLAWRIAAIERRQSESQVQPQAQPLLEDIDVFALYRGADRYFLIVSPSQGGDAINTVFRWAADPELSLSLDDAIALTYEIETRCMGNDREPEGKERRHESHDVADWDR